VSRPARAAAGALLLAAALAAPAAAERPEIHYLLHCQGCHRADGAGSPHGIPALRGSVGRFLAVPGGRAYLVRVPGSALSPLSDGELAALLNWMIGRFGPADAARDLDPYSAAEVGRYRGEPLVDVAAMRARLIERIDAISADP
jgi:hypothetical protein